MSEKNTGGPAFPHATPRMNGLQIDGGMTLRDYFAAKAMQASLGGSISATADNTFLLGQIAENAYAMADAMLKAREA